VSPTLYFASLTRRGFAVVEAKLELLPLDCTLRRDLGWDGRRILASNRHCDEGVQGVDDDAITRLSSRKGDNIEEADRILRALLPVAVDEDFLTVQDIPDAARRLGDVEHLLEEHDKWNAHLIGVTSWQWTSDEDSLLSLDRPRFGRVDPLQMLLDHGIHFFSGVAAFARLKRRFSLVNSVIRRLLGLSG
jgi:hypothetical protein